MCTVICSVVYLSQLTSVESFQWIGWHHPIIAAKLWSLTDAAVSFVCQTNPVMRYTHERWHSSSSNREKDHCVSWQKSPIAWLFFFFFLSCGHLWHFFYKLKHLVVILPKIAFRISCFNILQYIHADTLGWVEQRGLASFVKRYIYSVGQ